eukprot:356922-Chlamydomonas_euryale.AAC.1
MHAHARARTPPLAPARSPQTPFRCGAAAATRGTTPTAVTPPATAGPPPPAVRCWAHGGEVLASLSPGRTPRACSRAAARAHAGVLEIDASLKAGATVTAVAVCGEGRVGGGAGRRKRRRKDRAWSAAELAHRACHWRPRPPSLSLPCACMQTPRMALVPPARAALPAPAIRKKNTFAVRAGALLEHIQRIQRATHGSPQLGSLRGSSCQKRFLLPSTKNIPAVPPVPFGPKTHMRAWARARRM